MSDTESVAFGGQEEDLKKYGGSPEALVLRWLKEINTVKDSRAQNLFERTGEKIIKNYKNSFLDESDKPRVMYNVLWSNVQVLKPSLYSRMPKVVVERRFKDSDPVGRLAAQIAERATSFMLSSQQDRFNYAIKAAVEDRLLPGRGQVWLRYDAEFEESVDANGEPIQDEAGNAVRAPKPNSEKVVIDPLNWKDYFHSAARNPYEIRWVARRSYMTRAQLVKRFGKIGELVELSTYSSESKRRLKQGEEEFLQQAEVFEIWDLEGKKNIWISDGYKEAPLDFKDDILKLNDFFPCPVPLLATTTTDSMYPTADYKIYEKLADELDYVTKRISSLVETIRMVGVTASQFYNDIKSIMSLDDGKLKPVDNWQAWTEKQGFRGAIDWLPFDNAVNAIQPLRDYQQSLLSQVFEITGIPDIVRGATDPDETATAQRGKLRWVGIKNEERSRDVQRFCRETISKMAEIIFEAGLFSDETIALMCGVDQMPEDDKALYMPALQLLRDDRLRTFRVDIETDSTIAIDEIQDQQSRMEYIQAIASLVGNIQNISQFRPELTHPIIESALFVARAFRTGRPLEGSWEKALQMIEDNDKAAAEAAANQPPPPDYETMKLQIESEKNQIKREQMQVDMQQSAATLEIEGQKLQIEAQKVFSKAQVDQLNAELDSFKAQFTQFVETKTLELEQQRVFLSEREKMIEEQRLAAEQIKEERESRAEKEGGKGGGVAINLHPEQPVQVVHQTNHNRPKRKLYKINRTPEGLVGESIDVPDEAEAAS